LAPFTRALILTPSKSTPRQEVDTLSRKNESPSQGHSLEDGSRVGDQGDEGSPALTPSLASLNSSLGSSMNNSSVDNSAGSPVQSDSGGMTKKRRFVSWLLYFIDMLIFFFFFD
jgi:hypothetical protein